MKKLTLMLIFISFGLINIDAQITGGGNEKVKDETVKVKGVFKNSFYIALSRTSATGDFGGFVDDFSDVERGSLGMNKGMGISIGQIFYFNSIRLDESMKIGLDVTYGSWAFCYANNRTSIDMFWKATNFFGVKVGPVFSYNPVDKLIIDARFTLQPTTIIYNGSFSYGIDDWGDEYYSSIRGNALKIRTGFGIYARYKPFLLGFEISGGKTNMDFSDYDYYFDEEFYVTVENLPTGRFDLVFGFSF